MPLLSYDPMEDGEQASANLWNIRLSAIHDLLNGNIDSANLANGAVTTPKIANGSVTSEKLAVTTYVDDNGWTVSDFGTYKTWKRRIAGTPGVSISPNASYVIPSVALPVGIGQRSEVTLQATMNANDRVFYFSDDTASTGTTFFFRISNWYNNAVTLSRYSVDLNLERYY